MKIFLMLVMGITYVSALSIVGEIGSLNATEKIIANTFLIIFFSCVCHFIAYYEPSVKPKKYIYTNQGKLEIED